MGEALDVVRAMNAAWREERMEDLYGWWDPDIVVRPDAGHPDGTCFGHDKARRFYEAQGDALGHGSVDVLYEHDLGDRALQRMRQHVESRSGIEGEFLWTAICTVRDSKVIMIEYFLDEQDGLRAVGLAAASPSSVPAADPPQPPR